MKASTRPLPKRRTRRQLELELRGCLLAWKVCEAEFREKERTLHDEFMGAYCRGVISALRRSQYDVEALLDL